MTKWQSFLETIKTYKAPEVKYCKACGHVIPDPIGNGGQPIAYCNDQCRWDNNKERKKAYEQRQLALRKAQAA